MHGTNSTSRISVPDGAIIRGCGAVFDVGIPAIEAFLFAIGIIVAVIPEGLRPTVTLSLAMAIQRLARRGVLVKKLAVVETLDATSVICTDKSGTLTQNQMTVREVWAAGQRLNVSGLGYEPKGEFSPSPRGSPIERDLEPLLTAALLCNNARLTPPSPERPQWSCLGDPTEAALRVLALKGGLSDDALNEAFPRIHELPFDARRKRMGTIHERRGEPAARHPAPFAFVKGAPKEVLALCTHILKGGQSVPLDPATRAEITAANDDYARGALRVLALARRELPAFTGPARYTPERIEQDLTFLGLAAMMDPPRPEVAAAVKICREAGIRLLAEGHEVKVIDDRVDVVLNQADILAKLIAEEMSLGDMMTLLKLRRGEYSLVEEKLPPASQFLQGSLMELPLPSTCVIAAVIRHGKVLVPRGNMRFEIGDEVLAVVDNTSLPDLRRLFAPA